MKRRISLLLAVVMILGTFSFTFAAEATPEEVAGEFLMDNDVIEGINGELKLEDNFRRQDMVVMISRLMGAADEAAEYPTDELTFTDFSDPYYRPIIAWAVAEELIEGHTDERFGFGEDVTAQQYATVLLRALGYNDEVAGDGYDEALELAADLGILGDYEFENDDAITRGEMFVMTFNALKVTMKDSDETLAEFLGIEMPEEEVTELEVVEVRTDNLGEIVVELSNAELVDEEKLVDNNNYRLVGRKIEKVTVDENDVILLLDKPLVEKVEYELIVRNIDRDINDTYDFTAKDNAIPVIEDVIVLGEYGIKVITSEPLDDPSERSFLIDGRNVAMVVEQFGREIILTPYHKVSFPEDAETLTIKSLRDYAGFKSEEVEFPIEIVKDDVAPEVEDVVVKGNVVEVTFDKDVYRSSVAAYWNNSNPGNISYEEGRHTIYAEEVAKTDVNKVEYTFARELPRDVEVTIEGVQNHSKVKMEKTSMVTREIIDYTEPEVIDEVVVTTPAYKADGKEDEGKSTATIYLYFDKDVRGIFEEGSETKFDTEEHFTLYRGAVAKRFEEEKGEVVLAEYLYENRKDVIVVEVNGLNINNRYKDYDYILEVRNFTDVSSLRNRMYRHYVDFSVSAKGSDFVIKDVDVFEDIRRGEVVATEITLTFTERMYVNRDLAEDPTNYIFTRTNNKKYDVEDLGGYVETQSNGNQVVIVLPEWAESDFLQFEVLQNIKDKDGVRLSGPRVYDFATKQLLDVDVKDPVISKVGISSVTSAGTPTAAVKAEWAIGTITLVAKEAGATGLSIEVKEPTEAGDAKVDYDANKITITLEGVTSDGTIAVVDLGLAELETLIENDADVNALIEVKEGSSGSITSTNANNITPSVSGADATYEKLTIVFANEVPAELKTLDKEVKVNGRKAVITNVDTTAKSVEIEVREGDTALKGNELESIEVDGVSMAIEGADLEIK